MYEHEDAALREADPASLFYATQGSVERKELIEQDLVISSFLSFFFTFLMAERPDYWPPCIHS
jgi:hypothetical protein